MKNNKFIKNNIIKIIDNLYKLSGKTKIPDVKKICLETKLDRQTAMKFFYVWWDQCYVKEHNNIEQNGFVNFLPLPQTEQIFLARVHSLVECLFKEVTMYSELLNNLPHSTFPLGNHILNSLQEIENQIFIDIDNIHKLANSKSLIQEELRLALEENNRLSIALLEQKNKTSKELKELTTRLDDSKRELAAANHRIKSFKRDKRKQPQKNVIDNYYLA